MIGRNLRKGWDSKNDLALISMYINTIVNDPNLRVTGVNWSRSQNKQNMLTQQRDLRCKATVLIGKIIGCKK